LYNKNKGVQIGEFTMSIQVTFDEKDNLIVCKMDELLDWQVMERLAVEISRSVIETKCRKILVDLRQGSIHLSTAKIVMTPKKLAGEFQKHGVAVESLTRAVLIGSGAVDFHFLENVSLNQNQRMRIFTDKFIARQWLMKEP
jgi:hypothetical protein